MGDKMRWGWMVSGWKSEESMKDIFTKQYGRGDIMKHGNLALGESDQWISRGIISCETNTGRGNHRSFSFWNLLEAKIAKSLSVTFGMPAKKIETVMQGIRACVWVGEKTFKANSILSGSCYVQLIPTKNGRNFLFKKGQIDHGTIIPLVAMVDVGFLAKELIESIKGGEE